MRIALLGAGAWGTALAIAAASRHEVLLWARDAAQAADMVRDRCNRRYLPEVPLPDPVRDRAPGQRVVRGCDPLGQGQSPCALGRSLGELEASGCVAWGGEGPRGAHRARSIGISASQHRDGPGAAAAHGLEAALALELVGCREDALR